MVIDNAILYRNYFMAMIGVYVLSFLFATLRIFYDFIIVLEVGIVLFLINTLIYVFIKPRYFSLQYKGEKIFLKTNWETDDFIVIPKVEYGGFQVKTSFKKYKKTLILYKKTPKGLMGTKDLSITLLNDVQLYNLLNILNQLKKG
jgi:hypothetical protein